MKLTWYLPLPLVIVLTLASNPCLGTSSFFAGAYASSTPGIALTFRQLHWLGEHEGDVQLYSRVGEVELDLGPEAAAYLVGEGAYVNIVTELAGSLAWSVRNLRLSYPDEARLLSARPSVQFSLGNEPGEPVSALPYALTVSPEPLPDAALLVPDQLAFVTAEEYHAGGYGNGGSSLAAIPQLIGDWGGVGEAGIGEPPPPYEAANGVEGGDDLPAVNEDRNGCAPGAIARSLRYLADNAGGDGMGPSANAIYDELWEDMGTTEANGTRDVDIIPGKNAFLNRHDWPVDTGYFGWPESEDDVPDYMLGLFMGLEFGADVEILIKWFPAGGHAAMVTDLRRVRGGFQVTFVDDPRQGNGRTENREHVVFVDYEGYMWCAWTELPCGYVDGFIVEVVVPAAE